VPFFQLALQLGVNLKLAQGNALSQTIGQLGGGFYARLCARQSRLLPM
jgi:hypothetical protein